MKEKAKEEFLRKNMVCGTVHMIHVCLFIPYLSCTLEGYYSINVDVLANISASGMLALEAGQALNPTRQHEYTKKPLTLTDSCGNGSSFRI